MPLLSIRAMPLPSAFRLRQAPSHDTVLAPQVAGTVSLQFDALLIAVTDFAVLAAWQTLAIVAMIIVAISRVIITAFLSINMLRCQADIIPGSSSHQAMLFPAEVHGILKALKCSTPVPAMSVENRCNQCEAEIDFIVSGSVNSMPQLFNGAYASGCSRLISAMMAVSAESG